MFLCNLTFPTTFQKTNVYSFNEAAKWLRLKLVKINCEHVFLAPFEAETWADSNLHIFKLKFDLFRRNAAVWWEWNPLRAQECELYEDMVEDPTETA